MPEPESDNKQEAETPIQTLAAGMSKSGEPGTKERKKFQSTHAQVMKGLTEAFYQLPKEKTDDAAFLSMVILDAKAARLRAKARTTVESHELAHISGNISATLSKMQQSKSTVAFHSQYVQQFAPLQADANQRQMQAEELGNAITTFLGNLHTKLKGLDTKSESEREKELSELSKQWQQLEAQTDRLGINMESLLQKLNAMHQEAYNMLPAQDKAGLPPPAVPGAAPRAAETVKTAEKPATSEPGQEGPE
ncbi:hypothetical protein AQUSIP_04770 [Aquicella siphonis]|uniref:Uncharacterized protein n=1 Tax=Aquicella siphonis TaxID=254247 RepID=A0A5E4PE11_9COXI|nr:hypothetical protein [Aquicella siphonis]VVC75190.1 hypothetical protein AQUSIP_04770 [Aquicella siphonis]